MAKKKKQPKRIAGVKVPKSLRKTGRKAAALLDNRLVADLVAAALLAAAAALRESKSVRKAASGARAKVKDAAKTLKTSAASRLGPAVASRAKEGAGGKAKPAKRRSPSSKAKKKG